MINVDVLGRMGNQMFQYAFALNAAEKLKTNFFIIPTEKFELTKYFKLDFSTRLCYNKLAFYLYKIIALRIYKEKYILQINHTTVELKNNFRYKGFFQSENYFTESKNKIKKNFILKKKWTDRFTKEYKNLLENKYIVMHFRRTDYLRHGYESIGGENICLPMKYYDNCLNLIENLNEYIIVCVSDDIKFVKEYYKDRPNYQFYNNEQIIDFQLILKANIAIIANSSFSWWAGYLNETPNKIIYTPKYWLGFKVNIEYPLNITPKEFTTVNVN